MYGRRGSGFDNALICENGHVINTTMHAFPEYNTNYCQDCGAKAISSCPSCSEPIRGENLDSSGFGVFPAPKYCHKCGVAYTWTKRRQSAVLEYAEEIGGLDEDDRNQLEASIVVLSTDTPEPQSQLAAARLKKIFSKLGTGVKEVAYKMVVDIASETGKKILLP